MRVVTHKTAVVIGKFYPPHLGHHHLINTAAAAAEHVDVLVVDNPQYRIPANLRRQWLASQHPQVSVYIIDDIGNDDDSVAWAAHTMQFLRYAPDVVFSSEDYGITWAKEMGAQHVMVDRYRQKYPIAATDIRADLPGHWQLLADETKAGLATRIVVVGAESTGTTTLTQELAKVLKAPWVPEIGRYYTESTLGSQWCAADFHRIGKLQQQYEAAMAMKSNSVVICDTNAWATQLWQRRYLGYVTTEMQEIAAADRADFYIVTGDEIPFVNDGIRDGEHIRHEMHQWFMQEVAKTGVPFLLTRGSVEQRLQHVLVQVMDVIATKSRI